MLHKSVNKLHKTVQEGGKMKFGEKLRMHRREIGLTQAELAKKAELGLKTIINYEKGSTYPQNRDVYKILAGILNIDPDYLHNENDDFIEVAKDKYGYRGKKQAEKLVEEMGGLFAGGELSEEDIDGVMRAMQELYWQAKDKNKKYTPKKYNL